MSSSCRRSAFALFAVAALVAAACGAPPPEPATLVVHHGKIVTVEDGQPEVAAMAVRGDRIVALGTEEEIAPFIGAGTQVVDLKGALAIPGFIDSHGHFQGTGQAKLGLDLMNVANWDEVVSMVEAAVKEAKPGEWIIGRGWHQEKWNKVPEPNVEGFPTHASIDKVSPDNPVLLTHASGHASFANKKAMDLAGVTRATKNPSGGEILKDARGEPIGIFRETASGLIGRARSADRDKMSDEERAAEARRIIELADRECLENGVTTFHDAGVSFETVDLYKEIAGEGKLGVRLYVMVREGPERLAENLAKYKTIGFADNHVTVRSIKVSIDGALGPRGAWLLEPYQDLPGHTGLNTTPVDTLREVTKLAVQHGYQVCVHCIGDRANREMLNVYEETLSANPQFTDHRWRDEHTQHLHPDDIARFGKLGVIAAMQGIHCTSDAPYVMARLGEKRAEEGAYVWQKLMKTGAVISNGTDVPVEDISPIASYYASVSRRLKDGTVFYPDQRMFRMEALKSYTINGAFAGFEEDLKGSFKVGKLADIAVLSKDILTVPEEEIPSTQVLYTIVGGKVLYQGK